MQALRIFGASRPAAAAAVRGSAVASASGARRFLNLHEYQSKDLMEKYGVQVQKGRMAETAKGAAEVAKWIKTANGKAELILKSQIHAGGRGKGVFDTGFKGGVKICDTPAQVEDFAKQMLGHKLITKQTGPQGECVNDTLLHN
jgi:succinyl-CoA synthetase beta subunit